MIAYRTNGKRVFIVIKRKIEKDDKENKEGKLEKYKEFMVVNK